MEVIKILESTKEILEEKINSKFIPLKVKNLLNAEEVSDTSKHNFEKEVITFYCVGRQYLEKWSKPMEHLKIFNWMLLDSMPDYTDLQDCFSYLETKNVHFDENVLFSEYSLLKNILSENKLLLDTNFKQKRCCMKWVQIFSNIAFKEQYVELLKCCQYVFSLPSNNATVERVFSMMNIQWTDERNRLDIKTVENILICLKNNNLSCSEFSEYLKNQNSLLLKAAKSDKYDK